MKIKFHGAAHTVTGSQHLLEINGHRLLLECDPHQLIEGMICAAYTIQADLAYIFIRAEYHKAAGLLREAIAAGATEVVVLPYFLSAGRHVVTDIPGEVNIVRAESPEVEITLSPYLGASPEVVDILLGLASGSGKPANSS